MFLATNCTMEGFSTRLGRASYRIFSWGGNFFFIAGETMWLIDHSEGEGVGGGCAPSHAAYSAETYSF